MPAPLAKGIVISVAVLIAAGFAVYENPQVRQWVQNSRRKISLALHNLGDDTDRERRQREDISMTEQVGEEAEERRRKAREDIMRRSTLLESRRKSRTARSAGSFDALVDKDGRLIKEDGGPSNARATGIDLQESGIIHRRPDGDGSSVAEFNPVPDVDVEEQRQILEAIERSKLQLNMPSEASSTHPSESLIDLTPTSEFPGADFDFPDHTETDALSQNPLSESEFESAMSAGPRTPQTEDGEPDFYYVHPNQAQNSTNAEEPPQHGDTIIHDVSSAPSIASSLGHMRRDSVTASSDGTMSDMEFVRDVHTPASWSEVGSVISSNDGNMH